MTDTHPQLVQAGQSRAGDRGYFWLSSRPLHIALFLLPIVILSELGTFGLGEDGVQKQLAAHQMLVRFFELFGVLGLHLPALALMVVLVIQHILAKDKWKIEPIVPAAMTVESAFLTGPLLIMVLIIQPGVVPAAMDLVLGASPTAGPLVGLKAESGILLALGAGLYEEMLFRLILITAIHFVAADLLRVPDRAAKVIAVLASALLFAFHHDAVRAVDGGLNLRLLLFYVLAGVYFGILFLGRGLGIAVGVHAMYDLLVLVIMPGFTDWE